MQLALVCILFCETAFAQSPRGLGLVIAGIAAPDQAQPSSVSVVVNAGELSLVGGF